MITHAIARPTAGDVGEEVETVEVVPTEEPLSVPDETPAVVPAEPVPA